MFLNVSQCFSMFLNASQWFSMFLNVSQCFSMFLNVTSYIFLHVSLLCFAVPQSSLWSFDGGSWSPRVSWCLLVRLESFMFRYFLWCCLFFSACSCPGQETQIDGLSWFIILSSHSRCHLGAYGPIFRHPSN